MSKGEIELKSNLVTALRKALYKIVQTEDSEIMVETVFDLCDEISKYI